MSTTDQQDPAESLRQLKLGIREVAHDISNPLGVLRMAAYYLQHGKPDKAKQEHYLGVITETVEKIEKSLQKLRSMTDKSATEKQAPERSA
jgi:nitrogen-specific signal transduction histidine kinase